MPNARVSDGFGYLHALLTGLLVPLQRGFVVALHYIVSGIVDVAQTLLRGAVTGFPGGLISGHRSAKIPVSFELGSLLESFKDSARAKAALYSPSARSYC